MYRIIDKTTKLFLRDDTSFNEETEQAIEGKPPLFGYNSMWNGEAWEDTRTDEELEAIKLKAKNAKKVQEAKSYLEETKYVNDNFTTAQALDKVDEFLAEISDTYGITNAEILQKRWETRALINELGE